jgi:hypothetical protein
MSVPTHPAPRRYNRPGAGRSAGLGPYREATTPLRVPNSQLPAVRQWLASYRSAVQGLPVGSELF